MAKIAGRRRGSRSALVLTGLGWLAQWWPALDIVNNGAARLGGRARSCSSCSPSSRGTGAQSCWPALLAAINVGLVFAGLQGAAAEAAPDAKRFLRVVTFNLWLRQRPDRRRRQISQPDRRRRRRVAGGDARIIWPAAASGAGLTLSLQRGRVRHRHLLEIRDQGRRPRRPAGLSRMDLACWRAGSSST